MRTYKHEVLNQTVSANVAGDYVDCEHLTFLAMQVVANGTLDCDINLQVSNDAVNWVDVVSTVQNFTGNTVGMIEVVDLCAAYARPYLTANSGSSSVVVTIVNKGNS